MNSSFFIENRQSLYSCLDKGSLVVVFSNEPPRKTNDEYHLHFTNRNFMYLTGVDQSKAMLFARIEDSAEETLFIPPPDTMAERWHGRRVKDNEASGISGVSDIQFSAEFENRLDRFLLSGSYSAIYIPL